MVDCPVGRVVTLDTNLYILDCQWLWYMSYFTLNLYNWNLTLMPRWYMIAPLSNTKRHLPGAMVLHWFSMIGISICLLNVRPNLLFKPASNHWFHLRKKPDHRSFMALSLSCFRTQLAKSPSNTRFRECKDRKSPDEEHHYHVVPRIRVNAMRRKSLLMVTFRDSWIESAQIAAANTVDVGHTNTIL